jgi:hypothetical protein
MDASGRSPRPAPADAADAALLGDTRPRLSEQRERWRERLGLRHDDEALFELEVLLEAAACFSNPRNHPGPARRDALGSRNFRAATEFACEGLSRAAGLARLLLGERARASNPGTPEAELIALRNALLGTVELGDGVMRASRVSYRLFHALLATVSREVERSAFFDSSSRLELRPEFDRIPSAQVLELIRGASDPQAERLVALTFLSLLRMEKYLSLLERLSGASSSRRQAAGSSYLVLGVLRSEARALSDHLRRRAGGLLADSFERQVLAVPALALLDGAPGLRAAGAHSLGIKRTLEGIGGSLRLEFRRAFQHDLLAPDAGLTPEQVSRSVLSAVNALRPALKHAALFLGKTLGGSLDEAGLFDAPATPLETSERLRRDVWMFAQIVRAFVTKAQHSTDDERWCAGHRFQYVREFLAYFRALGYPLLRAADYPRAEAFVAAMARLEDTDWIDPARLRVALEESTAFHGFLSQLFEHVSAREELALLPFDRHAAAATLRLYLGD